MKYLIISSLLLLVCSTNNFGQASSQNNDPKSNFYLGYDLGEMAFNKFQNFAGEVGFNLKNQHAIRFVYLNIKLTEDHLSSDFARAVDGDNVTGHWVGYELFYDVPLYRFKNGDTYIYGGLSAGYHKNSYEHTVLAESFDHQTGTVGLGVGFRDTNVFGIKGLYMNFQIPVRYNFNKLEETKLGNSTVNKVVVDQTISFFVGYEF